MDYIIELLKYIFLGIVQGITEIFPVSSSGHLVLFSHLFPGTVLSGEPLEIFLMISNMGSFIALIFFYWKDIVSLIKDSYIYIFKKDFRHDTDVQMSFFYVLKLLIAVIPIGVVGFIVSRFFNLPTDLLTVGLSLMATSIFLFLVFLLRNAAFSHEITWKNAVVIGFFQMFAVLPGLSRSGITMVGGLSEKISIEKVLRFSFLSYIIVSVPVSLLGIYDTISIMRTNPASINLVGLVLGFVFSFIFSWLTVQVLSRFVKVKNLVWFSGYALLVGALAIILYFN